MLKYAKTIWTAISPQECHRGSVPSRFEKQCQQIISMVLPIVQTSVITLLFLFSLHMKREGSKPFKTLMPYVQSVHDNLGDVVIGSLWNALYILAYVVFVTVLFLYIYKNQYQTLGHLIIVSAFVVAEFGFLLYWFVRVVEAYQWKLSYVTVVFVIYNVVAGGAMCVFYKNLHLTQEHNHNLIEDNEYYSGIMNFYLLINSVALGWPFACFSEWTVAMIIVVLILWDCPPVTVTRPNLIEIIMLAHYYHCKRS